MKFFQSVSVVAIALLTLSSCEKQEARRPPKPIVTEEEKTDDTKDPNGFKLMSFNVRYANSSDTGVQSWDSRKAAVCEMVNTQKPAVMGVQECLVAQRDDILAGCKDYDVIGVGRDDGKTSGEMMAIFYRKADVTIDEWGTFWLSLTPDVPSKDWESACKRCATWAKITIKSTGKKIFYFNTHLDHQNGREEQMSVIEEKMAELNTGNLPVFLSADFNVEQDDPLFNNILTYMSNTRKVAPITDSRKTYHAWGKTGSGGIIDDIFFTTGTAKALKYCTVTKGYANITFISDHYPIYGIFEF